MAASEVRRGLIDIRQERDGELPEICRLVRTAFAPAAHSDGQEHELVRTLHRSAAFIPELSLVAVGTEGMCGYILFTKAQIGPDAGLVLAPLAVAPEFQRQGIGSALIREGHARGRKLGYEAVLVLGSEHYYPRFGYMAADKAGIQAPAPFPRENFMALSLTGLALPAGKVVFAPEFGL